MRGQNIIAAFIAVFVAIIIFLASVIFSFNPFSAPIVQPETNPPIEETTETVPDQLSCAELAGQQLQTCCETWAESQGLLKIQCVGDWTLDESAQCSWQCQTEDAD